MNDEPSRRRRLASSHIETIAEAMVTSLGDIEAATQLAPSEAKKLWALRAECWELMQSARGVSLSLKEPS